MTPTSTDASATTAGALAPLARTVACLDGSRYAASVCEHAAWLAGEGGDGEINLLHALEPTEAPDTGLRLIRAGGEQIEHLGARLGSMILLEGGLHDVVRAKGAGADVVVLGKRGETSPEARRSLGSNAAALLRTTAQPLLLVSQVYLPVHRALVLIDADQSHRRAVEFVASHPALCSLSLDIILMQPIGMDAEPKLSWARQVLDGCDADVYPLAHGGPDGVANRYVEDHGVDIIVMSRQMLLDQERGLGLDLDRRDLWALRTPIFIC
jgi:nucleotide-binding universal stress UspA family protein